MIGPILLYIVLYNFIFASFVLASNISAKQNLAFAAVGYGLAMWSGGLYLLARGYNFYWPDKLTLLGGFIVLGGFYFFSAVFPSSLQSAKKIFLQLLPLAVLVLLLPLNLYIKRVSFAAEQFSPINGPLFPLMASAYLAYIAAVIRNGYLQFRANNGYNRQRLSYVFFGLIIFLGVALIFDILLPAAGNSSLKYLGPIASLFFMLACAAGIVSYRLMDIRLLAKSVVVNVLSGLLSLFFLVWVARAGFRNAASRSALGLDRVRRLSDAAHVAFYGRPPFVLVFAAALLIFTLAMFLFSKVYEKLFLGNYIKFNQSLNDLNQALIAGLRPAEVLALARKFLKEDLRLSWICYYDVLRQKFIVEKGGRLEGEVKNLFFVSELFSARLKEFALHSKDPVFFESAKIFDGLNPGEKPSGLLPLYDNAELLGFFLLGPSKNLNGFSAASEEDMKSVWAHIQTAFARALLYQNMENKIKSQVREITSKNKKFEQVMEERMNFLQQAAHQLRTPAAAITGSLELIRNSMGKKRQDLESAKQNLELAEIAYSRAKNLNALVNGILGLAKVESGSRFADFQNEVDLERVFKNIIPVLRPQIENKGLILEFGEKEPALDSDPGLDKRANETLPDNLILGNADYLEQVFFNIIENAVIHTAAGKIKIYFQRDKNFIIACVQDTGSGIDPSAGKDIFKKYARGKDSQGTGLGLFMAKTIISAHKKAHIWYETSPQGTTFYMRLKRIRN